MVFSLPVRSFLFKQSASILLVSSSILSSKRRDSSKTDAEKSDDVLQFNGQKRFSESGERARLIFLGTGSSTGCPKPICSIINQSQYLDESDGHLEYLKSKMNDSCKVSRLATEGDPRFNKNYRNNPSILINYEGKSGNDASKRWFNVIIDVGKTFREGAIRWMPHRGAYSIDSIVLTHEHFDAIGGLDDVRGFQIRNERMQAIDVFASMQCLQAVKKTFSYLFPNIKKEGDVARYIASLRFRTIESFKRFEPSPGLTMIPLPILHGEDLVSLGFAFSKGGTNVVYLSDISRMPEKTAKYIVNILPPTDILIVDSLTLNEQHNTHYCLTEAICLIKRIKPRRAAYIVGMNCDKFPPHDDMNFILKEEYPDLNVRLAHDGLVLDL